MKLDTRAALMAAAYVPKPSARPFAYNVLQTLTGAPVARCRRVLARAARAGLVTRTDSGNYLLTEKGETWLRSTN